MPAVVVLKFVFSKVPVLEGATYKSEGPTKSRLLKRFTYVVVVKVVVVKVLVVEIVVEVDVVVVVVVATHSQSRMT